MTKRRKELAKFATKYKGNLGTEDIITIQYVDARFDEMVDIDLRGVPKKEWKNQVIMSIVAHFYSKGRLDGNSGWYI